MGLNCFSLNELGGILRTLLRPETTCNDPAFVGQNRVNFGQSSEIKTLTAESTQNFVTSVKLNSRTFMAGTTMSNDSSPHDRTGTLMTSTFESM